MDHEWDTIYDAGSRAFWLTEYAKDVESYWRQTRKLADHMTFYDLLAERMPRLDAKRFSNVNLREICEEQIAKIFALMNDK